MGRLLRLSSSLLFKSLLCLLLLSIFNFTTPPPLRGAVLFSDDFEDPSKSILQWRPVSGLWEFKGGKLVGKTNGTEGWIYFISLPLIRPFIVSFDIRFLYTPPGDVGKYGGMMASLSMESRWRTSGYDVHWVDWRYKGCRVIRFDAGSYDPQTPFFLKPLKIDENRTYHWRIVFGLEAIILYIDEAFIMSVKDTKYMGGFYIGLWLYHNNQHAEFDNIEVKLIEPQEDLNPPKISKVRREPFRVTPDDRVLIEAEVEDLETGVDKVILLYSSDEGASWIVVEMNHTGGNIYRGMIPAHKLATRIDYTIIAVDKAWNVAEEKGFWYIVELSLWHYIAIAILTIATIIMVKRFRRKGLKGRK